MAYVCSCDAVTTRTVREAISRGARNIEQIGEACGAGTTCFGCHPTLESLLDEHEVRVAVRGGRGRRMRSTAAFAS